MKDQVVFLILDEEFQGDITELSKTRHLWVCNSKLNTPKIKEAWDSGPKEYKESSGVTSFDIDDEKMKVLYSTLGSIDEHHSGDEFVDLNPWSLIRVFGVPIQDVDKGKVMEWLQIDKVELVKEIDGFSIIRSSNGN